MNIVFLSPHFPPNFRHFISRLREFGANVLGVADVPYDDLGQEVKANLTEYYRVPDMHDYDALVRAIGYLTFRYGKIDRIESQNEYWLATESRLRTDFNVFGIKLDQISKIKRKSEMKEVFEKAGLSPAHGRICSTEAELRQFIKEFGLPVVAKPDIGVGAAATYKIDDEESLQSFLKKKDDSIDWIVEEFINAPIVTFDGLVDSKGDLVFTTSHRYSHGVMDVVNEDTHVYYYAQREIDPQVERDGLKILKAFDVRERFFHFEFFDMGEGKLIPLEVNMRPPGGLTLDMFNFNYDFDCYRLWAELVVKGDCERSKTRPYFVMYVSRKDHIPYKLSHYEVLNEFRPLIIHHERICDVFSRAIGNHGYVLRHAELQPLIAAANAIHEQRV